MIVIRSYSRESLVTMRLLPLEFLALVGKPPPSFRPKNSLFLRNRGRWFQIWSWFARQSSSFGDICILPFSGICTRSTRTSLSCTPWSQLFYSIFFQKFLTFFTFIKFMRVLRVYVGYLLLRVYVGYFKKWIAKIVIVKRTKCKKDHEGSP